MKALFVLSLPILNVSLDNGIYISNLELQLSNYLFIESDTALKISDNVHYQSKKKIVHYFCAKTGICLQGLSILHMSAPRSILHCEK